MDEKVDKDFKIILKENPMIQSELSKFDSEDDRVATMQMLESVFLKGMLKGIEFTKSQFVKFSKN